MLFGCFQLRFHEKNCKNSKHRKKIVKTQWSSVFQQISTSISRVKCFENSCIVLNVFFFFLDALFYGSIASFVSGVLLLMSFASPYWLQSWEDTQSPFKNMGLWEFCFYKFRHPDYQFDHLFHGCHALYGDEYRLIREKLLPGWLMVVQLFVTLALIASFLGQMVIVCLLLRAPLEWILRFEWYFCGVALVCKGVTGD